jgi:small subunit ribosomal protein S21
MVNKFNKAKKTFGLKVELDERLPFEKAIRLFKRKVEDSGLLKEVKDRMEFEKPSVARKVAKNRAVKRWQKKQEKTHLEGKSKKY